MSRKIEALRRAAEAQSSSATVEQSSVANASRTFESSEKAVAAFATLKEKLLHIERWNDHSGVNNYALFNADGKNLENAVAKINDFICISLPGTIKNDWVKIIDFHQTAAEAVLTVQPSYNPTEEQTHKNVTSHFFTSEATNNFCLELKEKTVNFFVIGLNEKSNVEEAANLLEAARNFATANIGSLTGFQKAEWQTFCERFLQFEPQN